MPEPDPLAVTVARLVREREQPELTILFGSRARGDHSEQKSDIDVLLIDADEPAAERKWSAALAANETAASAYGRRIPVQLIWRTLDEFRHHRRYVNSVETNAIREGIIMPRNPGDYSLSNYEDDDTEYEYDWSNYDERLRHAEAHLDAFLLLADAGRNDLIIGQQAQNVFELGMKALIVAAGGAYSNTHNIGDLLGAVRHFDKSMADFRLNLPPDPYTQYEGEAEYRPRRQPQLTEYEDYVRQTSDDISRIINRARELRDQPNDQ